MNARDHFKFWDSNTRAEMNGRQRFSPKKPTDYFFRVDSRLGIVRRKNSVLPMLNGLERQGPNAVESGTRGAADMLNHLQELRKEGGLGRKYWRAAIIGARRYRLEARR